MDCSDVVDRFEVRFSKAPEIATRAANRREAKY